jgi:hypothetical protein
VVKDKHYYSDGTTSSSYNHNKTLHRVDGPAYEGADGSRGWWVGGERLSEEQFEKHPARLRYLIEKSIEEELVA